MGDWYDEGCPCSRCGKPGAEERYSFGYYAGRYCDECYRAKFRDAADDVEFDPMDAGESLDGEPDCMDWEDEL